MKLNTLTLRHFRNYVEETIEFSPHLNFIHGANAQGKTNLLEAIFLLMTGRSFRTPRLNDLIHFDANTFYLEAHFTKDGVDQVLKMEVDSEGRKVIHNATYLPKLSALIGLISGVLLSPKDHDLIKGNPSIRRYYLDLQIARTSPLYIFHLSRYLKAMKQRNTMLRRHQLHGIEIWEEEMAKSAAFLTLQRKDAIDALEKQGHPLQSVISQEADTLSLHYHTTAKGEDSDTLTQYFIEQWAKGRPRETELGATLIGPHKDDLKICLNGQEARYFGSEGQQRLCVTALRFAEWIRLKQICETSPLMCIDDVGISFDEQREKGLYDELEHMGQVFLTSPHISSHLPSHAHIIEVEQGKVGVYAG